MDFKRLRLSGFKSFVEPTELHIEPGLTGVVGPNGCGKSNLLEALRWVMGESSYKRMRASGMDDVIFSGSASRPERNMAEVTITLDNADRTAPAAFNDADLLEISRRIEREAGSAYRINGKDVRAKDVQLLFADASTGSRSPSLVRQGQIGEIVNAKPQSRRRILEEAAGITGLYTRRHEAELRLNAAETNLTRLEDVIGQLEVQLGNLKRQARQATRYKNVSGDIRKAEATQLYIQWRAASDALNEAEQALRESQRAMGEHSRLAAEASKLQAEASEAVPPLREAEMVKAAILQRLTVEREGMETEEARAEERKSELEGRLAQIGHDLEREREITADTDGVLARLDAEEAELAKANASEADGRAEAEAEVQETAESLRQSEARADEAAATLSALQTRRTSLDRSVADLSTRLSRVETELAETDTELGTLLEKLGAAASIAPGTKDVATAQAELETAEQAVDKADAEHKSGRTAETEARQAHDQARRAAESLDTEVRTLEKVLSVQDGDLWPPLIDAVTVTAGYEAALGAALGDDLDVPADEAAPAHWKTLGPLSDPPALPGGVSALADYADAPAALARRLSQVGVVEADQGVRLQGELKTGQRLVSKSGDLWRWDGFSAAADAPTAAAIRLAERNRLLDLRAEAETASKSALSAKTTFEDAQAKTRSCEDALTGAREALREANRAVVQAREAQAPATFATGPANDITEAADGVDVSGGDGPRALIEATGSARYAGFSQFMMAGGGIRGTLPVGAWYGSLALRYTTVVAELGTAAPELSAWELGMMGALGYSVIRDPVRLDLGLVGGIAIVDMSAREASAPASEGEDEDGDDEEGDDLAEGSVVDGKMGIELRLSIPMVDVLNLLVALDGDLAFASLGDSARRIDPALPPVPGYSVGLSVGLEVGVP